MFEQFAELFRTALERKSSRREQIKVQGRKHLLANFEAENFSPLEFFTGGRKRKTMPANGVNVHYSEDHPGAHLPFACDTRRPTRAHFELSEVPTGCHADDIPAGCLRECL